MLELILFGHIFNKSAEKEVCFVCSFRNMFVCLCKACYEQTDQEHRSGGDNEEVGGTFMA